jgi:hypothetical protein
MTYRLKDNDIIVYRRAATAAGLAMETQIRAGGKLDDLCDDKACCESHGGTWHYDPIAKYGFCADNGTGDWD